MQSGSVNVIRRRSIEEVNYEIYDELVRLGERFKRARSLPVFSKTRTQAANEYFKFSTQHRDVIDWASGKRLPLPK